jgi:hypothetical protein
MKKLLPLFLVACVFANSSAFGQIDRIGRLIDSISNDQVGIVMQYVWYPAMKSRCGDSLANIGKLAARPLINVLDDRSKGIIAHFILSKIYRLELSRTGHVLGSNVWPVENEKNVSLRVFYMGFIFYVDNKNHLFAKQDDLNDNKKFWQKFFNELSYQ